MANNNTFNTRDFLNGAFYAPIALGEHEVTLKNVRAVIEEKDDGTDASYILCNTVFENGREVSIRFYGVGAQIFCNQLRAQLQDDADYDALDKFLKTLKGKQVNVYVSKRTYTAKDGTIKSTLQYDFVEPTAEAEDAEDEIR